MPAKSPRSSLGTFFPVIGLIWPGSALVKIIRDALSAASLAAKEPGVLTWVLRKRSNLAVPGSRPLALASRYAIAPISIRAIAVRLNSSVASRARVGKRINRPFLPPMTPIFGACPSNSRSRFAGRPRTSSSNIGVSDPHVATALLIARESDGPAARRMYFTSAADADMSFWNSVFTAISIPRPTVMSHVAGTALRALTAIVWIPLRIEE